MIHSIVVCLAAFALPFMVACSSRKEFLPENVTEVALYLNIEPIGLTKSVQAELPDNEKMKSVRVIVLHADGTVEHNRHYSLDGAQAQKYILLKVKPHEKKKIFLFANEESVSAVEGVTVEGVLGGKQTLTDFPEVLESREQVRRRLSLDDNLPRGTRPWCKEQYAEAVELLCADRYVTVQDAAERCQVSYSGLKQHLIFYHKELVGNRIKIREQAVRQRRKGKITGRGTLHAPSPETIGKYAEALHLYRTTPMSARKIARQTGVSIKGFYEYLQTWHKDLVCGRKGIPYEEGKPVDWSSVRRYNPATAAKYADAIARLKEGGLTTAKVAAEFGLHPDCFRQYLKEHEPELHARLGMKTTENGKMVSPQSMEKYKEAIHLYETTSESLKSIARRFGLNDCSLGQFIKRHFPELIERRKLRE